MKKYIKPQITVINVECSEMLATSVPINRNLDTEDDVIDEQVEVLTKGNAWDRW